MKYHIVYKTTNIITQKQYIGIHTQYIPPFEFDGYLGSGKLLKLAIAKHGAGVFIRETLFVYDLEIEARCKESELVNIEFILREDTYNICLGGQGGNTTQLLTLCQKQAVSEKRYASRLENGKSTWTSQQRQQFKLVARSRSQLKPWTLPDNKGRQHTPESMQSFVDSGQRRRSKYIWITNGNITVHFIKTDPIPYGWVRGRGADFKRFDHHTTESKDKIRNHPNIHGVTCYTDGTTNKKLKEGDQIPPGFKLGMTQQHNKKWITNGVITTQIKREDLIPDGWKNGRTLNIGT
jgi:hypothetical protein